MKKNLGFSSFEFYFVVSVIGLILLVGINRYHKLAEETQRLSFEILAKNFSAAVYSHRARWFIAQQLPEKAFQLPIENSIVQFSLQGWPIAVAAKQSNNTKASLSSCLSLWNAFLQDPPPMSVPGMNSNDADKYRLSVTVEGSCRFELLKPEPKGFYFEYSPVSGQVKIFTQSIAKNS